MPPRRHAVSIAAIALSVLSLSAHASPPPSGSAAAMAELGVRADFPAPPRHVHGSVLDSFESEVDGVVYQVNVVTYPGHRVDELSPNPSRAFVEALGTVRDAVSGGILRDDVTALVDGRPARTVTILDREAEAHARWIVAGRRLYSAIVFWDAGADRLADAKRFVASLKLTAAAPPALPVRWQRRSLGGVTLEAPSALRRDTMKPLTVYTVDLPFPALSCGVVTRPHDGTPEGHRAALAQVEEAAQHLAAALGRPSADGAETRSGRHDGHATRGAIHALTLDDDLGGGAATYRYASYATERAAHALIGYYRAGGEALLQRCWDSVEVTGP